MNMKLVALRSSVSLAGGLKGHLAVQVPDRAQVVVAEEITVGLVSWARRPRQHPIKPWSWNIKFKLWTTRMELLVARQT